MEGYVIYALYGIERIGCGYFINGNYVIRADLSAVGEGYAGVKGFYADKFPKKGKIYR